jgi:hypothetical protein
MAISKTIDRIVRNVALGSPHVLRASELISYFEVNERNTESVEKITNWLGDRDVECIPSIDVIPLGAKVTLIKKRNNAALVAEAKTKLQMRLLPLANKKLTQIPIVYASEDLQTGEALTKLFSIEKGYVLVAELVSQVTDGRTSQVHRYVGFLDVHSWSKSHIAGLGGPVSVGQVSNTKFIEVNAIDSLVDVIDRLISTQFEYVVIRGEMGDLVGAASLRDILSEYYPLSKPYLVLSVVESNLVRILRALKYSEDDYISVMAENTYKVSQAANPRPESLTMYQKITMFRDKYLLRTKCTEGLRRLLQQMLPELEVANNLRNALAHFKPEPLTQSDMNLLERISDKLSQVALTISRQ